MLSSCGEGYKARQSSCLVSSQSRSLYDGVISFARSAQSVRLLKGNVEQAASRLATAAMFNTRTRGMGRRTQLVRHGIGAEGRFSSPRGCKRGMVTVVPGSTALKSRSGLY